MRQSLFPPGAIQSNDKARGIRSPWREFEFWCSIVKDAIIPTLSIEDAFENWGAIKECLMENSRDRLLQIDKLCALQ